MKIKELEISVADAASALIKMAEDNIIMLGPVVKNNNVHGPYFTAVTKRGNTISIRLLMGGTPVRDALCTELIASQTQGLVIHHFSDEMDMAEMCAATWPCDKSQRIRNAVRRERMN